MNAAVGSVGATRTRAAQDATPPSTARALPAIAAPSDMMSLLAATQLAMRDARTSQAKSSAQEAALRRGESIEKARDAEKAAEAAQRAAD